MTKNWGYFIGATHFCCWFNLETSSPSLPIHLSPPFRSRSPQPNWLAMWMQRMPRTLSRSITGLVFEFCGGPLAYKSKIQSTVSTSSTKAKFLDAVHAAKIAKYLRSILCELVGYPQFGPTTLFEDNAASILMVNANCPTHPMPITLTSSILPSRSGKLLRRLSSLTSLVVVNSADSLTKSLGSMLHHRRLMGH